MIIDNDSNGELEFPRLVFQGGFDERAAYEAEARGYRAAVHAEFRDGRRYELVFYDAGRLAQDLQDETELGQPFIGDPGLVILSEVTLANMEAAVAKLTRERFFDAFVPCNSRATKQKAQTTSAQRT